MSAYCTRDDIQQNALGAAAFASLTDDQVDACITKASALADTEISNAYSVPLESWPDALSFHVAKVAAFLILSGPRGFKPDGIDQLIYDGYKDGIRFFERVGAGKVNLSGSDSDGEPIDVAAGAVPEVYSDEERGI